MKNLLPILLLLSLNCFGQDTIKMTSNVAFKWADAYFSQPIYIDIINKKDSVNEYQERINDKQLTDLYACDTALTASRELNKVLLSDTVKSKHDAKWRVIWRKSTLYLGTLLLIENGVIYLIWKRP